MQKLSLPLITGLVAGAIGVMSPQFEASAGSLPTVQKLSDVVVTSSTNPWAYLVVEGESYYAEANDAPGAGFVKVFNDEALTDFYGVPILSSNTTASGNGALFTQSPAFGEHADKATYSVQFATPGTYYLYMRFTMFENGSNLAHYISEDSFFVPPDFNKDPQFDWPLPRGGYTEGCCDTSGYLAFASPGSEGVRTEHRSDTNYFEGNFHWNELKSSQFNNPMTQGEPNLRFTYTVTPEMVGVAQNFTISYREGGTTIDLFLFSTNPDLMDQYTQNELDQLLVNKVTVQAPTDVVSTGPGSPWSYLVMEGESYASEVNELTGFTRVRANGAISNVYGSLILAPNTTASQRGALHTPSPIFSEHADKVTYKVQFATPGTYYIYMRFTMFENGGNLNHYLNEDSFFVPPDFNKDPQTDWPLPRGGYTEGCCGLAGYLHIAEPGSGGVRTDHGNPTDTNYWEGNFHWNELRSSQFNNPLTQGEQNLRFTYTVTPEMVGVAQNFTISYREGGTTIDLFLFSTNPDLMDQYTQSQLDQILVYPTLKTSRAGSQVTVSWPTSFIGFNLESTGTLSPANWQPVPVTARTVVGNNNTVTVDAAAGAAYYRLRQP